MIPENVIVLTSNSWYVIFDSDLDELSQIRQFISAKDDGELSSDFEFPEFLYWGKSTTYRIHRDEIYSGSVWEKLYPVDELKV